MACQYRSKVWVNGWCDVAHRYCAPDYESACKYNKTKGDRIRAMSDEELAKWIARTQIGAIKDALDILRLPYDASDEVVELGTREALLWLKQPAEGE